MDRDRIRDFAWHSPGETNKEDHLCCVEIPEQPGTALYWILFDYSRE
jgi:hypothetical protein